MTTPTPPNGKRGRAAARAAFTATRAGEFDRAALTDAMAERLDAELEAADTPIAAVRAPKAFATGNVRRWVPIGPSVIRAESGRSFKRATGRIRDLRVSSDGVRAYAATAKGGVWYTGDAGQFWSPVGGWAERPRTTGGVSNAQACGCLLVSFGATVTDDYVMVGTGELQGFSRPPNRPALGGVGVLAARGPASTVGAGGDPWEPQSGLAVFEGKGLFRLVRDPAATVARTTAPGRDRVLAATNAGLYLGVRQPAPAPHNGEFTWGPLPALGPFMGLAAGVQPIVTDALWLARGAQPDGRIVVAVAVGLESANANAPDGSGVVYSDDLGATFHWVSGLDPTAVGASRGIGRMSFANPAADRVYVLGERNRRIPPPARDVQSLWRIPAVNAAAPSADLVGGMPEIWTRSSTGRNQRDYDQAIAVDVVAGVDRVYLGGNYRIAPGVGMVASLWCFDVTMPGLTLTPAPGISRTGPPQLPPPPLNGGDGAAEPGLIGDDVHADVHMIRLAGGAGLNRHVWVSCDGGVYVSTRAGRVNTFAARSTGLSAVEVNFHAAHPTSTHFGAIGTQDNGRHVRVGDVVWQDLTGGDGGGVAIHPFASQFIVSQYNFAGWVATPDVGFVDPLDQGAGAGAEARESGLSAFYAGATTVRLPPATGRLAVGTNRVWLSDDLGGGPDNTWKVLPYPSGPATNPRAGGLDPVADRGTGVPGGAPLAPVAAGVGPLGEVLTTKWAKPRVLLVLFARGLVRWTQDPITLDWTARVLVALGGAALVPPVVGAPNLATTMLSDFAPIPGTDDFYLVTTGNPGAAADDTCLLFTAADSTFRKTGLRAQLAPLDPAYAATVDPGATTDVYVGTVTGVWRGVRAPGPAPAAGLPWPHTWTPEVNGMPLAAVQDLDFWTVDPLVAGPPRLLRACLQSRGVWELDVSAATEPQRTYLRVHAADDRRRLPTPMLDPRLAPAAPAVVEFASPDIVVRPRPSPATAPTWRLPAAATLDRLNVVPYQLWTFQTAFRWLYPSVQADGRWSDALGTLVELHRSTAAAFAPIEPKINQALWDSVVGTTRVSSTGAVNAAPGDPLAVYRPPWQTPAAMGAAATEIDLLDNVLPVNRFAGVDQLFSEPSVVDVLIHHRDIRPLAGGDAFAMLLWREDASRAALLGLDVSTLRTYASAAAAGGPAPAAPAGWNRVLTGGSAVHRLPVPLDARMPRAVSIELDLTTVGAGNFVLLVAFAGSSLDRCASAPVGLPAAPTIADLVRRWPYAAARLINLPSPRP